MAGQLGHIMNLTQLTEYDGRALNIRPRAARASLTTKNKTDIVKEPWTRQDGDEGLAREGVRQGHFI